MKAKLYDDGYSVVLDLHGLTIETAEETSKKVVKEAYLRGRDRIKLIHGSSTTSLEFENRSIKNSLYNLLQSDFSEFVSQSFKFDDYFIIAFDPDYEVDTKKMELGDYI